jgi:hypothetical protein
MGVEDIAAEGIRVGFDPEGGFVTELAVEDGGRTVAPLHRAPWVGSGEALPEGLPLHLAKLQGDFLCAPFAASENGSPMHGWPANARWIVVARGPGLLRAVLERPVMGASVVKELSVQDGSPFLCQRHLFVGGEGRLSVANHAMVSLPDGGLIRCSPKAGWESSPQPQETDPARGRSGLRYPARAGDPRAFPGAAGGPVDLTRYPWGEGWEDFAAGIEAEGRGFGWTAVTRRGAGDLYLSLRDARVTPMTMLWHSHGGRDWAPWSGRHRGCLGVEEGAAGHMLGVTGDDGSMGLRLAPDGVAELRHVIGAIAWPEGEAVAEVALAGDTVLVRGEAGTERRLRVRAGFLGTD